MVVTVLWAVAFFAYGSTFTYGILTIHTVVTVLWAVTFFAYAR